MKFEGGDSLLASACCPYILCRPRLQRCSALSLLLAMCCALAAASAAEPMLAPADLESPEVAEALLAMAREAAAAAIAGRTPQFAHPLADLANAGRNGVHILLLAKKQTLGEGLAKQTSLAGNIRVAAGAAVEKCRAADLDNAVIFLTIFGEERSPDCPPLPSRLRRAVIVGEEGVRAEYKGLQSFIPPLAALQAGWGVQNLFEILAQRMAPPPAVKTDAAAEKSRLLSIIADPGFKFFVSPAVCWASLPKNKSPLRVRRLGRMVGWEEVKAETIRMAVARAAAWLEQEMSKAEGLPGILDLRDGKRQAASPHNCATAAAALGGAAKIVPQAVASLGQRILARAMAAYREDSQGRIGFILEGAEADLGAAASALLAMARLESCKDDQRAARLAAFLKGMRRPDGSFEPFYPPRENTAAAPDCARNSEAQAALWAWAGQISDPEMAKWLQPSLAHDCEYLDSRQDLQAAPGLARICAWLGPQQVAPAMIDLAVKAAALLASTQQTRAAAGEAFAPDTLGCFANRREGGYDVLDAAATARALEGLAYAYVLAKTDAKQRHKEMLRCAVLRGLRYLLQLQIRSAEDALFFPWAADAIGAFRAAPESPLCRLGDLAACISALAVIYENFAEEDYRAP